MSAFLKIENPGVCPIEAFTVLGVSFADTSDNQGVIGTFGSGSKHGVALCLRHNIPPIVFAGSTRMEFGTRDHVVNDGLAEKQFKMVTVKVGSRKPEDLGFVMDYGKTDWAEPAMALREFVSNAIDRTIRETGTWKAVKVEVVEETQVRAKAGTTRVFVPLQDAVFEFYKNLGRWFLHFSEPEMLDREILPKADRNMGGRKAAVIYRKGVRVREFESADMESLFDYNLNNLSIDEARKASDWDVQHECGKALSNADQTSLGTVFNRIMANKTFWELTFQSFSLRHWNGTENLKKKKKAWKAALTGMAGENAVVCNAANVELLERKGYNPVVVPEGFLEAATTLDLPCSEKVLSQDEQLGREIIDATPDAQAAVDYAWHLIEGVGMTNGKTKPPVKSFKAILDAGVMTNGYYHEGVVYINESLGHDSGGLSDRLIHVALEEIVHWITNATDNSRDFQDYLLQLAVKLAG